MGNCAFIKHPFQNNSVPYNLDYSMPKDKQTDSDVIIQCNEMSYVHPSNNNKPGNPGTWDHLNRRFDELNPRNFDGLHIMKNCKLSKNFNVNHTFIMSGTSPTGYRFGASFVGSKIIEPHERYPSMNGLIMPNGSMNASFSQSFGCHCRFQMDTQIDKDKFKLSKYALDYRTDDFTISSKITNIDLFKCHGKFSLQFLQSISPRIAVGAEVSCWKDANYLLGNQSNMSGALRYSTGRRTISTIIGEDGLHITYHHIASRELQLGVALKTDMRNHYSDATFVYKLDLPKLDIIFRGTIKSDSSIGAVIEKNLHPVTGATLLLSAYLNHKNRKLLVGIGLNLN